MHSKYFKQPTNVLTDFESLADKFFQYPVAKKHTDRETNFVNLTQFLANTKKMPKLKNYKKFEGRFIPEKASVNDRSRTSQRNEKWQGESDREEKFSDPRWHRQWTIKKHVNQPDSSLTPVTFKDAIKRATERKKHYHSQKSFSATTVKPSRIE